jgi:uncharacterized protein (TIGR02284 family)
MTTTTSERFETIAHLLVDSQKGYAEAADIADDAGIKQMFADRARERATIVEAFRRHMPGLDVRPDDGTVAGAGHRLFINLRRLVQDDTRVALSEVERGEDTLLTALRDALDDSQLTGTERGLIADLHERVLADRDRFAALKRAY